MANIVERDTCFPDDLKELGNALFINEKIKSINNPYTGNKKKIIIDIWKTFESLNVNYTKVLDLFSGSGTVGLFFKMMGSNVISNDLLSFPYLTALAFIENNESVLSKSELDHLLQVRQNYKGGFIYNTAEYTDVNQEGKVKCRFLPQESVMLDSFYKNLEDIVGCIPDLITNASNRSIDFNKTLCEPLYKMAFAMTVILNYVMSKCHLGGRLNKGQVLAELEFRINRQFQNDRSHSLKEGMSFKDIFMPDIKSPNATLCFACQSDAIDLFDKNLPSLDLIYIDPPYGGQQSDYSGMYRFCEEYIWQRSCKDIPYINNSQKFSKKKGYEEQFYSLLSKLPKQSTWAISYNNSSWSDINQIQDIVKHFKSNIVIKEIHYEYQYRKQSQSNGIEYLIIGI